MIVYTAVTTFNLLSAIVHRCKYHQYEDCILIYASFLERKVDDIPLRLAKYFARCVPYDVASVVKEGAANKRVVKYFNKLFKRERINLNKAEIYVGGPQYFTGIYLASKEIAFNLFEEASGMISRPERSEQICAALSVERAALNKEHGLFDGSCPSIKTIIYNAGCQLEDYVAPANAQHFDVVQSLLDFDDATCDAIVSVFADLQIITKQYDCILLSQHFAHLMLMSTEEQILIYQVLFDYFLRNEKVLVKTHPDDMLYYDLLFPQAEVLFQGFPSEFTPFAFAEKPGIIASISSTAIYPLRKGFERVLEFDDTYEVDYRFTNRYYVAISIALQMQRHICFIGVNRPLVKNLIEFGGMSGEAGYSFSQDFDCHSDCVYVIDAGGADDTLARSSFVKKLKHLQNTVVFINSRDDYVFYDYYQREVLENVVPVTLQYEQARREDFYANLESETIHLYSTSKDTRQMANEYTTTKELENTGLTLAVEKNSEHELQIKQLKGALAATEKRLLYYIKKEQAEQQEAEEQAEE